ncbi:MAG: hypothetical protein R3B55_00020 [Candidatus Paceibacterota bacterium]
MFYAILNTRLISRGINLSINGVENGKIYEDGVLAINGNAKRAKHVLINGREISLDQEGEFKYFLVLLPGYNIVTISAEDKFGKETKKTFDIVREEKNFISLEGLSKSSL